MSEESYYRRVQDASGAVTFALVDVGVGGSSPAGGFAPPKVAVYSLTTSFGAGLVWEAISDEIGLTEESKGHALELPGPGFCSVLAEVEDPGTVAAADVDCLVQWSTAVAIETAAHLDATHEAAGFVVSTAAGATPQPGATSAQIAASVEAGKVLCPSLLVHIVPLVGTPGSATPDGSVIKTTVLFWTYGA